MSTTVLIREVATAYRSETGGTGAPWSGRCFLGASKPACSTGAAWS
jgi:hypothetical protein